MNTLLDARFEGSMDDHLVDRLGFTQLSHAPLKS
jgi:hypothetical protein